MSITTIADLPACFTLNGKLWGQHPEDDDVYLSLDEEQFRLARSSFSLDLHRIEELTAPHPGACFKGSSHVAAYYVFSGYSGETYYATFDRFSRVLTGVERAPETLEEAGWELLAVDSETREWMMSQLPTAQTMASLVHQRDTQRRLVEESLASVLETADDTVSRSALIAAMVSAGLKTPTHKVAVEVSVRGATKSYALPTETVTELVDSDMVDLLGWSTTITWSRHLATEVEVTGASTCACDVVDLDLLVERGLIPANFERGETRITSISCANH